MSTLITTQEANSPVQRTVGVPDNIREKILAGDAEAALRLSKGILAKWEKHPTEENSYFRLMDGHRFYIKGGETNQAMQEIMRDFLLHGDYEPHTTKLIESILKPGDIAVDIGASIGYFTLLMARKVGNTGVVYSWEPTKNQYPYLCENVRANGYGYNVEAYNLGAWSEDKEIELKTNLGSPTLSRAIKLDTFFNDPVPKRVDFIKIDVDGAEPEVLKGLEQTIKNNPQLKMVIEYYPEYIKNMGLNPQDMIDFLDKYFTYERIGGDFAGEAYYNLYCVRKQTI